MYSPFHRLLGINLISENGEIWKRHRRVIAPAFNHVTYRNVWDTTIEVYNDMLDKEGWRDSKEAVVSDVGKLTHKVTFYHRVTKKRPNAQ